MVDQRIVKTYAKVAAAFSADLNSVKTEWKKIGIPGKPGRWDLLEIAKWRLTCQINDKSRKAAIKVIADLADQTSQPDPTPDPEQVAAAETRKRKTEAEAEIKEIEMRTRQRDLAIQEGRVIDRESAVREVAALVVRIKQRLLAAPGEMEMDFPRVTRKQNKADFELFVRGLLLEMAGWQMLSYDTTNQLIVSTAQHIELERQKSKCKSNGRHPKKNHSTTKRPKKK